MAKLRYRHVIILGVTALIALAGYLRAFSWLGMPDPAQTALAILLMAATLWISEAIPLFVTSFVILLLALVWLAPALRAHELPVENVTFLAPFFSDVILLFLGGFTLSSAMQRYRIDEQLAGMVVSRAGRSIPGLMISVMAITAFLSMWLSNTATAAMMLALCLPIARSLPPEDSYRKALVLSVPLAANIGGLGTPIGSPPNAIAMQYMRQWNVEISFAKWMLVGVPGVLIMLCVSWLVLMLLYRGRAELPSVSLLHPPTRPARGAAFVVAVLAVTIFGWLTESWHGYSAGTVALLPVIALFGTRVLSKKDLQALPWDVLLMMGGGLSLGAVVSTSGLADWFADRLDLRGSGLLTMIVVFGSVSALLSSVMSNTAAANLIMPLIMGIAAGNRAPMLVAVAFSCTLAMPLPISTPPNAVAFSSGELTAMQLVKAGSPTTLVGLLLAFTTGYVWWGIVGLY